MILGHRRRRPAPATLVERARERGAALVEFAIIAMFIVVLIGGAFDYGMAWRVGLVTNEAARTGARVGSGMDNNALADWYAISGAKAALTNSGRVNDVQRFVIYRSDTADGAIPTECKTATTTSQKCNIMTGAQFRAITQANFNTTTGCATTNMTTWQWCSASRNNVQLTAEYYGIWLSVRYNPSFKMAGNGVTVERDAVMRLEPDVS